MTTYRNRALATLAGFVLAATLAPAGASAAPTTGPDSMIGSPGALDEPVSEPVCHVTYQPTVFDSVIVAKVTIKNQSPAAINGWSLSFILPATQRIIASSGSTYESPIDTIVARDVGTNAYLPPTESVLVSFLIAHNGNLARPTGFSVNGHPCATA